MTFTSRRRSWSHLEAELHAEGGDGEQPGVEGVVVPEGVAEHHRQHEERRRHQQHGQVAPHRRHVGGAERHEDGVRHPVDEVQDGGQQEAHVAAETHLSRGEEGGGERKRRGRGKEREKEREGGRERVERVKISLSPSNTSKSSSAPLSNHYP